MLTHLSKELVRTRREEEMAIVEKTYCELYGRSGRGGFAVFNTKSLEFGSESKKIWDCAEIGVRVEKPNAKPLWSGAIATCGGAAKT